jgi:hypothetical protein
MIKYLPVDGTWNIEDVLELVSWQPIEETLAAGRYLTTLESSGDIEGGELLLAEMGSDPAER